MTTRRSIVTHDPLNLTGTEKHHRTVVAELEEELLVLQQRIVEERRKMEVCEEAIKLCQAHGQELRNTYGIHSHIAPPELHDCQTQMDAVVAIANRSYGRIKLADASKLVFDAGLSNAADYNGVKTSLHGQLNMRDEWEKEGERTGIYRSRSYTPTDAQTDADVEEHQWPVESCPTGDGDASPRTCPANEETVVARGRITV